MGGLENKSYDEASDDIFFDTIRDLTVMMDEEEDDCVARGLGIAVQYLRDKRLELYS